MVFRQQVGDHADKKCELAVTWRAPDIATRVEQLRGTKHAIGNERL